MTVRLNDTTVREEYRRNFANPYIAASRGFIDDVIDPRETRIKVIRALEMLQNRDRHEPAQEARKYPVVALIVLNKGRRTKRIRTLLALALGFVWAVIAGFGAISGQSIVTIIYVGVCGAIVMVTMTYFVAWKRNEKRARARGWEW